MKFDFLKTCRLIDFLAKYLGAFATCSVMFTLTSLLIHPIFGFCAAWWIGSIYFDVTIKDSEVLKDAANRSFESTIESVIRNTK